MLVTSFGGRSHARRMEATACLASPGRISSVAVASKLRVTGSQMKDMPLYLRTFFEYCPVGCTKPVTSGNTCMLFTMVEKHARDSPALQHDGRHLAVGARLQSASFG
jgi:hypothetical protein